ncbi:hypothetical protein B5C34_06840 [Pacificimonas flava]|uniref:Outer membrane protein n=2 Tax=Pacificimonas TaxID=1960290 RepID=A0A219B4T5_9SPHN|nr:MULTISPECIES: SIMPL domain-containing protein [Pacificimonas]MBZ6377060.1 SIMPL domain-containing protein [Pacificimonas aurantium]OWV33204.1 hypothetical protein B5C34_06840 [Pacificimonas flava]
MLKSVFAATAATLALAAQPAAAQDIDIPITQGATLLTINAQGEVRAVPDIATVSAGVITRSATAEAALADNRARMNRVIEALRDAGIERRDIQTQQLHLNPQYRYEENRTPTIDGYQAQNQVSVKIRDLDDTGPVLDALVAVGANQFNGPSFGIDDPSAAQDEARRDAMRKARERADLYAAAAGLSVARIVSISEGGTSMPTPRPVRTMARVESADVAPTPVESGELNLSASVTVLYELR